MLIRDAIQSIKDFSYGKDMTGRPINPVITHDQILFGDANQELTGIVTCIWPDVGVIRKAKELGYNLIITHENMFYNDETRPVWLESNRVFQEKEQLIQDWGGVIWRDHDYLHSKVPIDNGKMTDGICYAMAKRLGWLEYVTGDQSLPIEFEIPETKAGDLAAYIAEKFDLNGARLIGDADAKIRKVRLAMHLIGKFDDGTTVATDRDDVDCLLTMELTDYTTSEYIRDAAQLGHGKCIISIGHFNLEQPGMEYMASWLPQVIGSDAPVTFVSTGDTYQYITRGKSQEGNA